MTSAAIIGLGGAGRWLAVMLAQAAVAADLSGPFYLIDCKRVGPKCVAKKGYWESHLGRQKCDALLEEIRAMGGPGVASRFVPIAADFRSVPALLRSVDAVFIGVDSRHATGVCAAMSPGLTLRVALEMKPGGLPCHSVEVGLTGQEIVSRYSDDDWRLSQLVVDCLGPELVNRSAGVAQPLAPVAQALALSLFMSHLAGRDAGAPPYRLYRLDGTRLLSADGGPAAAGPAEAGQELSLSYDASLADLAAAAASVMGVLTEECLIEFDVPLEASACSTHPYFGFARYPESNHCECGERRTVLGRGRVLDRRWAKAERRSLRELGCPVGLGFSAAARGRELRMFLPLELSAVPRLIERRQEPGAGPEATREAE